MDEIRYYSTYGPTVLASNERVPDDHPLAGRSFRIAMPEAGRTRTHPALRAKSPLTLELRARLVAWAARTIALGTRLAPAPELLTGRLHDIASVLLQVGQLVYPECVPAVVRLLQGKQAAARADAAESREGRFVRALVELQAEGRAPGGLLGMEQLVQRLSVGDNPISERSVGWISEAAGARSEEASGPQARHHS